MNIVSFDGWTLPTALAEYRFENASVAGATPILGAAGFWDSQGDKTVLRPRPVRADFLITGATWAALDSAVDAARAALLGGRGLLKVAVGDSLTTADRRALARCTKFETPYGYEDYLQVKCSVEFEILQGAWDAESASSVSRSGTAFSVSTGGNAPVSRTLVITLNGALSASVTLTNTTTGEALTYDALTNTLGAGDSVEIDCGAMTVRENGATNRWDNLTLGNTQAGFMSLAAGANTFTASPAVSVDFDWRDAWF
jgi:hypothetical protein